MTLLYNTIANGTGLCISDTIDNRQFEISTNQPVEPHSVGTDKFTFPIDESVEITCEEIYLSNVVATIVRKDDGEMITEANRSTHLELSNDCYEIELCGPIKLYLRFESELIIDSNSDEMAFKFGESVRVVIGGRSHQHQPVGTITTTEQPKDVFRTISLFGSALKTISPERSFPTLRGHPPLVEYGDKFQNPSRIQPPESDIIIEIPPTLNHAFNIATLAFYLGARVKPGDRPIIRTKNGIIHDLTGREFEIAVERVLKQTFLLDCITRTEGLYEVDLHERNQIEKRVNLEFPTLYSESPGERLKAYLSVSFDKIAAYVPTWKLSTHLSTSPQNLELLPFFVNELAVINTGEDQSKDVPKSNYEAINSFVRRRRNEREFGSQLGDSKCTTPHERKLIKNGSPFSDTDVTLAAYQNRLARGSLEGNIEIVVVCNDSEMIEESQFVERQYGSRAETEHDISTVVNPTQDELRTIFSKNIEFLHFIGHNSTKGFECSDGHLDITTIENIDIDVFFLNACSSAQQGRALIKNGAIGGVVTVTDVMNSRAGELGKTLARLLNCGFPLQAALTVAADQGVCSANYAIVGDGNVDIAHPDSGVALLAVIRETPNGFALQYRTYPASNGGLGSMVKLEPNRNNSRSLTSGEIPGTIVAESELREILSLEEMPVLFEGNLNWSNEMIEHLDCLSTKNG